MTFEGFSVILLALGGKSSKIIEKREKWTKITSESLQTTPKPPQTTSNGEEFDLEWIWGGLGRFYCDFRSIFIFFEKSPLWYPFNLGQHYGRE